MPFAYLSGAQLSGANLYVLASEYPVISSVRQLGQPRVVCVQQPLSITVLGTMQYAGSSQSSAPAYQFVAPVGMVYNERLNPCNPPTHVRPAPDVTCPVEQVFFPTSSVQVTVDHRFPTWVHIECPNGAGGTIKGWIGQQHIY
jgi:hypothetical protein